MSEPDTPKLEAVVAITTWGNVEQATHGKRDTLTWQALAAAYKRDGAAIKPKAQLRAPCFCTVRDKCEPGTCDKATRKNTTLPQHRCGKSVQSVTALGLDYDGGIQDWPLLVSKLGSLAYLVHDTPSHTRDKPKWRIYVQLSEPWTEVTEWPSVYKRAQKHFEKLLGVVLDERTSDPCRVFYPPSRQSEADEPRRVEYHEGRPLDLKALLRTLPHTPQAEPPEPEPPQREPTPRTGTSVLGRASRYLATCDPSISGQGGHIALLHAASVLVRGFELSESDTLGLLTSEFNPRCEPPWTTAELLHKVQDSAKNGKMRIGSLLNEPPPERSYSVPGQSTGQSKSVPGQSNDNGPGQSKTPAERVLGLGERLVRLPTSFETLDTATRGGPATRRRVFLIGPPGANKTGIALFLGAKYLLSGCAVGILASDEDADSLLVRMGQILGYERKALECPDHVDHETTKADYAARLLELPFLIVDGDEDTSATVESVSADLLALADGRPSVLIVDSIQRARSEHSEGAQDNRLRADAVVKAIKRASAQGHLVIATSEANRAFYSSRQKANRGSSMSSAKESSSIEYAATVMLVLSSVDDTSDQVDVEIAKNRMGKRGGFRLKLDFDRSTYSEVDGGADIDEAQKRTDLFARAAAKAEKAIVAFVTSTPGQGKQVVIENAPGIRSARTAAFDNLIETGTIRVEPKQGKGGGYLVYLAA